MGNSCRWSVDNDDVEFESVLPFVDDETHSYSEQVIRFQDGLCNVRFSDCGCPQIDNCPARCAVSMRACKDQIPIKRIWISCTGNDQGEDSKL